MAKKEEAVVVDNRIKYPVFYCIFFYYLVVVVVVQRYFLLLDTME